jgi:hypothetical protein
VLHFYPKSNPETRVIGKEYYLWQFIDAGAIRLKLELAESSFASHTDLFNKFEEAMPPPPLNASFHCFYDQSKDRKLFNVSIKINAKQKSIEIDIDQPTIMKRTVQMKEIVEKTTVDFLKPSITIFEQRFTSLMNQTVLDYTVETDGLYDSVLENFKIEKPFQLIKQLEVNPVDGIYKIARFCMKFSLETEGRDLRCTKLGHVFFYKEDIEVYYHSDLTTLDRSKGVRFNFNGNNCTEHAVVNHTLVTICIYNFRRYSVITDLIDLSITYDQSEVKRIALLPQKAVIKPIRYHPEIFLLLYNTIIDARNYRSVSNSYYAHFSLSFWKEQQTRVLSPNKVNLTIFHGFDSRITDIALGVVELRSNFTFKMSGVVLACGNLVMVNIMEERDVYFAPHNDTNKTVTTPPSGHDLSFTVNVTQDIKEIIFKNAKVTDLVGHVDDFVVDDANSTSIRFKLLFFPNYHSFLVKFENHLSANTTSFYKLYNPFSELENQYFDEHTKCYKWACVLISQFGGSFFLRLYDMSFDRYNTQPLNFFQNWPGDAIRRGPLDLEAVLEEFTIHPTEILNVTRLQAIEFEEDYSKGWEDDGLNLMVFTSPNLMRIYKVNRRLAVNMSNIYFASNEVKVTLNRPHLRKSDIRLDFAKFNEHDFFKYFIFLGLIASLATLYCVVITIVEKLNWNRAINQTVLEKANEEMQEMNAVTEPAASKELEGGLLFES